MRAVAKMYGRIGKVITPSAIGSSRKTKLNTVELIAVEQHTVVIDLCSRRIPGDKRAVRARGAAGAHQAWHKDNEVILNDSPGVIKIRCGVIQAVGHGPIDIDENVLLRNGVG